jgi:hypothetical protein
LIKLTFLGISWNNSYTDCLSATTFCPFLLVFFLALFLRKIRDLQQRCGADAPHHLSHQR